MFAKKQIEAEEGVTMRKNRIRENIAESIVRTELAPERIDELLNLLAEEKLARDYLDRENVSSFSERCADQLARFAGSWGFILVFCGSMLFWIGLNIFWLSTAFDPYPFILLNLILSCVSALQSPIIMMSQNREAARDRTRSKNAYNLSLKSEILLEELHHKLDRVISELERNK